MSLAPSDVCELVQSVWTTILDLELHEAPTIERMVETETVTGCIQITGRWQGAVTIDCSRALAVQVAAAMFAIDERETEVEHIQDALGELTNIIGGNVKSLLPEPCQLSLPAVTEGVDYAFRASDRRVVARLGYSSQGRPFQVTVLEEIG